MIKDRVAFDLPAYEGLLAGHFRRGPGYGRRREGGTDDWLLIMTLCGEGRIGSAQGDLLARAGDLYLIEPGTTHDYGTHRQSKEWEILWVHFHPPAPWLDLLRWPEVAPGIRRLHLDGCADVEAAFREVIRLSVSIGALRRYASVPETEVCSGYPEGIGMAKPSVAAPSGYPGSKAEDPPIHVHRCGSVPETEFRSGYLEGIGMAKPRVAAPSGYPGSQAEDPPIHLHRCGSVPETEFRSGYPEGIVMAKPRVAAPCGYPGSKAEIVPVHGRSRPPRSGETDRMPENPLRAAFGMNALEKLLLLCESARPSGSGILDERIKRAIEHIHSHLADPMSLRDLSRLCHLSESRFSHLFRELTGLAPKQYILVQRLQRAQTLLTRTSLGIAEIAAEVGMDPFYLSLRFRKETGLSPRQYRAHTE